MYSEEKVGNVPDFDVTEGPERLHDMLSGDAHEAEAWAGGQQSTYHFSRYSVASHTVQNRALKSTGGSVIRFNLGYGFHVSSVRRTGVSFTHV